MVRDWWAREWLTRDWFLKKQTVFHIEMLTSADDYSLAEIHERSFAKPWTITDFERLLSDKHVIADGLFVGEDKILQGFALSRFVLDEGEVLTVALDPAIRRQGLSRALFQEHLSVLERKGVRSVFLEVGEDNLAALALYRNLGFKENGRREGYYRHKDGRPASALMMKMDF